MKTAIIIPARYGSTRFPGKPLAMLAGKTVLERVVAVAQESALGLDNVAIAVATDDDRILNFCADKNIPAVMTPADCPTGTDRVRHAAQQLPQAPDFIVNLQGDAPLTPPDFIRALIDTHLTHPGSDIVTPVAQLSWRELDILRANKIQTPFSGTTAVLGPENRALWFSKNIIPAIRKESDLRAKSPRSPVYRHIGLYGFTRAALDKFVSLSSSSYELLEGLEQLRALENGMTITCAIVDYRDRPAGTGIDSPEDLARAEKLLSSC
jgi:3-deoxy-manno-octulosonate cytidylyltransferase (CMP-KDO synthetase)